MALIDELQKQMNGILSARGVPARATMIAMATAEKAAETAKRAPGPLGGFATGVVKTVKDVGSDLPVSRVAFNVFDIEHQDAALALASRLIQLADGKGGLDGIGDVILEVTKQAATGLPGLAQYVLKLFLLHHPLTRQNFRLGLMEERQPNLARPSGPPVRPSATAPPTEDLLNFWREDPLVGDHHDHFHTVNPARGRPDPSDPEYNPDDPEKGRKLPLADRHGELFAYMHKQMIARYDAERLAVGLRRVKPLDDFTQSIEQGYDPKRVQLWNGSSWMKFGARPPGTPFPKQIGKGESLLMRSQLEGVRRGLLTAVGNGEFEGQGKGVPVTINKLALTEESTKDSVDEAFYGNHHGWGHILIGLFADKGDDKTPPSPGVILVLETAPRDPAFWRWHKHCDDVFDAWYKKQAPHDFSSNEHKPPVAVRDVILCLKDGLPGDFHGLLRAEAEAEAAADALAANRGAAAETVKKAEEKAAKLKDEVEKGAANLGAQAFGGDHWHTDFSAGETTLPSGKTVRTTDELTTEMVKRSLQFVGEDGQDEKETIECLSHDDFYYFIRLENASEEDRAVTVRLFLAPETEAEDYRAWIELDRFLFPKLRARERAVAFRRAEFSSVVRKPALRPEDLGSGKREFSKADAESWCDCGWPYTLLLPRGTESGMSFRLLAMLSSGDDLKRDIDTGAKCTSISFCGLRNEKYPDKRLMGYPFDRPFAGSISSTIAGHDNWASRPVRIRCKNL